MVRFVNKYGEGRDFADYGTKFVCGSGFFILSAVEEFGLVVVKTVEDNFFGIGDRNESCKIVERLEGGEFLDVWIADPVGSGCGRLSVEYHESKLSAQPRGKRFSYDPRRIESLDGTEAWNDGGLEARGC